MNSLQKQLASFSVDQLLEMLSEDLLVSVTDDIQPELIRKLLSKSRKKLKAYSELVSRGEVFSKEELDIEQAAIINLARDNQLDPADFGETFDSLGVFPWEVPSPVSVVDASFQQNKLTIKNDSVDYIKANPTITETDFYSWADSVYDQALASLTRYILPEYITTVFNGGLIAQATFNDFRDWVVATPKETIMGL